MPLNQFQRKHLELRITKALRVRERTIRDEHEELRKNGPPAVKRAEAQLAAAQKIVGAHRDRLERERDKAMKRAEKEADACRERVLFAEPDEALKQVQQFERP